MKQKKLPVLTALLFTAFVSCKDEQASTADPAEPAAKTAETKADYPLDTCVVSGEKLGSMGEPHIITHEGTEVRFCCDACVPKFEEDPDKYLAMLKGQKEE